MQRPCASAYGVYRHEPSRIRDTHLRNYTHFLMTVATSRATIASAILRFCMCLQLGYSFTHDLFYAGFFPATLSSLYTYIKSPWHKVLWRKIYTKWTPWRTLPMKYWDSDMIVMMMMIAFITIKSSLVPLIEGLCALLWHQNVHLSCVFTLFH